jgi:hypothetical protein
MEDRLLHQSINITRKSLNLLAIFVIVEILVMIINVLPSFFWSYESSSPTAFLPGFGNSLVVMLFDVFVAPFIDGGMYGLAFLMVFSKAISTQRFTFLAKKNFGGFFKISIVLGLIYGLYWSLCPLILKNIFTDTNTYLLVNKSSIWALTILIQILFVFSFPLVIVGFFSGKDLKPVRSSISVVIKNIGKIKYIIAIILISFLIGSVSTPFVPDDYWMYESIIMTIVLTPINFFVLIYSYIILTNCFFKELTFDFESLT